MKFAGVLPEDAPDPRIEWAEKLASFPIPVMGLVAQPTVEDDDSVGLASAQDATGFREMTATVSYTLWRNPNDRSDPINLAELDDETRRSIEQVPPWPRPAWLVERVQRMRYPALGDAVWTVWDREPTAAPALGRRLVHHVEHVLVNQFRRQLGLPRGPAHSFWGQIPDAAVNSAVSVSVDGVEIPAAELDTDPFVYGIGVELPSGGLATAVIPRDELQHVQVGFATRRHPPAVTTSDSPHIPSAGD